MISLGSLHDVVGVRREPESRLTIATAHRQYQIGIGWTAEIQAGVEFGEVDVHQANDPGDSFPNLGKVETIYQKGHHLCIDARGTTFTITLFKSDGGSNERTDPRTGP